MPNPTRERIMNPAAISVFVTHDGSLKKKEKALPRFFMTYPVMRHY
jgi:hypothetical protein